MPARNGEYQNLYTPLSQSMSDSDEEGNGDTGSEEELHSCANHHLPHHRKHPPPPPPTAGGFRRGTTNIAVAHAIPSAAAAAATDQRRRLASALMSNTAANTTAAISSGAGNGQSAAVAHHQHILDSMQAYDTDLAAHYAHSAAAVGGGHHPGPGAGDHVAILGGKTRAGSNDHQHQQHRPPMSPLRRALFIGSLLLCVLTVVVFVWVVPCPDGSGQCPARVERARTQNWVRHYEGLELKGAINVVRGVRGHSQNLVFMYRGERVKMRATTPKGTAAAAAAAGLQRKRNGIIALVGSTGAVSWFDEIVNEPAVIDCGLIDADRNGVHDCLVLDEFGELGCIDPVSGTWLWHIVARTVSSRRLLSFPLILPDFDGDGVAELLVVITPASADAANANATTTTNTNTNTATAAYNTLIIVSGANGRRIGNQYEIRDCRYVHKFQLDVAAVKVTFNCINRNGTELQMVESLATLHRLITNRSASASGRDSAGPAGRRPPIGQHKFYGQRADTLTQRNIYAVGGKQLIVENAGKCPAACNVTVQLVEQSGGPGGKAHVVRNFSGERMYGMVPALLSFNATGVRKQAVHGFVIKFWQWGENETDVPAEFGESQPGQRSKRGAQPLGRTGSAEFNRFADAMPDPGPRWRYPEVLNPIPVRLRRSTLTAAQQNGSRSAAADRATTQAPAADSSGASSSSPPPPPPTTTAYPTHPDGVVRSRMRVIRERVVLIVFNSTDTRIENTSQSNIVQFCQRDEPDGGDGAAEASLCQPDLNYQENSVLIADLDEDGSQELVTYYTTYVNAAAAEGGSDWKLMNYVQLLRLEAELPKLYVLPDE